MRQFFVGVRDFIGSFRWWSRRPGVMALGLIPAVIAGAILVAVGIGIGVGVPPLVDALTPFADRWDEVWSSILRIALTVAIYVGSFFLLTSVFVALTLAVGDPFYEKIWAAVEEADGGPVPESPYGFWRGVGDSLHLVVRGLGASIVAGLCGFIPVVGVVLGPVVGSLLTGRVLADELTSRALSHRGLTRPERKKLTRSSSSRLRGFGAAAYALMLIPILSVIVMPTAVAGSTVIARRLVGVRGQTAASA